jgi:hypothetical protein
MRVREGSTFLWVAAALALAACKDGAVASDPGIAAPASAGAADATEAAHRGTISCAAPEHDWGSVMAGEDVSHTFVVKNVGDGVLRILNARGG